MEYLEQREFANSPDFVNAFNKHRLAHKQKWIVFAGTVAGKRVEVKSFQTSIQILRVDGLTHAGGWDMTATGWKECLGKAVES